MCSDGTFPVHAIAPRWFVTSPEVPFPPLPEPCLYEIETVDKIIAALSSNDEGDPDESAEEDRPAMPMGVRDDRPTEKYKRMFCLARRITQKASLNPV
jgi:hypothetical protein